MLKKRAPWHSIPFPCNNILEEHGQTGQHRVLRRCGKGLVRSLAFHRVQGLSVLYHLVACNFCPCFNRRVRLGEPVNKLVQVFVSVLNRTGLIGETTGSQIPGNYLLHTWPGNKTDIGWFLGSGWFCIHLASVIQDRLQQVESRDVVLFQHAVVWLRRAVKKGKI